MNWQLGIVCLAVATAAFYLARSAWQAWRSARTGCGGVCGCGKSARSTPTDGQVTFIAPEQLTLRHHTIRKDRL